MYLLGKTCHLCHPTFNKDMVGPHTSAALVNLTAYTSEQTFVQIVPLSGAGLLVHLPRLPSGWTLLMPQALQVQGTALHPVQSAPGGKQCPWAGGLPTGQSIWQQAWTCFAAQQLQQGLWWWRRARWTVPSTVLGPQHSWLCCVPTPVGIQAHSNCTSVEQHVLVCWSCLAWQLSLHAASSRNHSDAHGHQPCNVADYPWEQQLEGLMKPQGVLWLLLLPQFYI